MDDTTFAAIVEERDRAIKISDDHLRTQVERIDKLVEAALLSADRLELERLAHLNEKIDGNEKVLQTLRAAAWERHDKFETSVAARFSQVNEFRGSLDDLGKTMATRRELETAVTALQERLDEQAKVSGELRSRLDVGPAALGDLQQRIDLAAGQQLGKAERRTEGRADVSTTTAVIGSVIAVILVVIAISNFTLLHSSKTPPATTVTVTTPAVTP